MAVFSRALEKLGVDPHLQGEDYKRLLEEAGFVDVNVTTFKIPIGKKIPPVLNHTQADSICTIGPWARNKKMKR